MWPRATKGKLAGCIRPAGQELETHRLAYHYCLKAIDTFMEFCKPKQAVKQELLGTFYSVTTGDS